MHAHMPVYSRQCTHASVPSPVYTRQCTHASVHTPVYTCTHSVRTHARAHTHTSYMPRRNAAVFIPRGHTCLRCEAAHRAAKSTRAGLDGRRLLPWYVGFVNLTPSNHQPEALNYLHGLQFPPSALVTVPGQCLCLFARACMTGCVSFMRTHSYAAVRVDMCSLYLAAAAVSALAAGETVCIRTC